MGNRRRLSQMLSIDDAYWGFVNKRRFCRWVYASMTLFAMFAVVVAFFDIGAGTAYAPDFLKDKPNLTTSQMNENERLLQWLYVFVPSPVFLGWFVVYFGKFFSIVKIKRLRKARNYRYNLLWASVASAAMYAAFIRLTLHMELNSGPKLRGAIIIAICEFGLITIEVYDEHMTRKRRHELKRLLRAYEQRRDGLEDGARLGNAQQQQEQEQEQEQELEQQQQDHSRLLQQQQRRSSDDDQSLSEQAREREIDRQIHHPVPGGML